MALAFALAAFPSWGQNAPTDSLRIREDIRRALESVDEFEHRIELLRFYRARDFAPAWTLRSDVDSLLRCLSRAADEGLDSRDYLSQELRARVRQPISQNKTGEAAAFDDIHLTAAYMAYSRDLRGGRVDPETLDPLWSPLRQDRDLAAELTDALLQGDVAGSLTQPALLPSGYRQLKAALARLRRSREILGERIWIEIESGDLDALDDEQVSSLVERLTMLGDLPAAQGVVFADIEAALARFQRRHGIEPSARIDQPTSEALNVPLEDRIRTVELNMERWRWLPAELGPSHISVNIAAFETQVVQDDRILMRIPSIVGRPYRRTPVFSALMTYLVFSPYWNVPNRIAVRDKLPLIQRDPSYLTEQGFRVFTKGAASIEVDPHRVDWASLGPDNFPYRLRQDPGPLNALGGVKFMMPNRYSVYLHDTPQRELFGESVRTFSSGCIRLGRPLELAQYLLRELADWTPERTRAAMTAGKETTVVLPRPVPVHILYLTAWATEDGELNFRDDVYGRDALLSDALIRAAYP